MPVYLLNKEIAFPPPDHATEEGILAVGGDLSPERLIEAYRNGIFPWYSREDPIIWWSPDPRFVVFPDSVRISRSMRKILKRKEFTITFDNCFKEVIDNCSAPRKGEPGTWITSEMREAYLRLHSIGLAHSVEAWQDGKLAGGLYGVSLGKNFFGESMFTKVSNASKAAFFTLAQFLRENSFNIIDCQIYTPHLAGLGAVEIERKLFIEIIQSSPLDDTITGSWSGLICSD